MQGFPDPYSGLAQGLTQGVQTGANIMQMVYQKAQMAKASEDKDLATALELLKDPNAPETFKNDIWKASARPILQKRFPKAELPEAYEWEDALPKQISAIQTKYGETNPEVANKMIKEIIAGSSDPVKSMAKYDTLLKSNETSSRGIKWRGTPPTQGLAAPSGYNPGTIDSSNTMYGLTGNIPGTPGVSGLSTSYPEDQRAIVGENYIQKGELPLPKDEKGTVHYGAVGVVDGKPVVPVYENGKFLRMEPAATAPKEKGQDGEGGSFKTAKDLRSEFISQSKNYMDVRDSYARIQASSKDPSPAGDVAIIFSYMRMLDPASTVREGEFATASNTGSIPERVRAQYNKALTGERLAESMRTDFITNAQKLYKRQEIQHTGRIKEYKRLAKEFKINPDTVIVDFNDPSNVATGSSNGKTVTVKNPANGEMETWDLTTEKRVK